MKNNEGEESYSSDIKTPEPLIITPLYHIANNIDVIHRIANPEGDAETVLLKDGMNGCFQVAIQDRESIHTIMEFPADNSTLDEKNRMCWTTFDDTKCAVLCVLVCATQVRIWDTGSFLGGGEGTNVHLPCEAISIFSAATGFIIQRRILPEDQEADDDLAFLSKPSAESGLSITLPSLFSLTHPLKTVLPVANTSSMEHLLFIGTMECGTQVCVTCHVESRRHAVWILDYAPPPKPMLLQNTSKVDEVATQTFIVEQDLLREEGSFYDGVCNRQEALADALGVALKPATELAAPSGLLHSGMNPLHPEFRLTLMYEALPTHSEMGSSFFVSGHYLYLHIESDLEVWKIKGKHVQPMTSLSCQSATPIRSVPGSSAHVLVVNTKLRLYRGDVFVGNVTHSGEPVLKVGQSSPNGRFTMGLQSGNYLRAALSLRFTPLVERVLEALCAVVGVELALHMRVDCLSLLQKSTGISNYEDPAWASLYLVIERLLEVSDASYMVMKLCAWDILQQSDCLAPREHAFVATTRQLMKPDQINQGREVEVILQSPVYIKKLAKSDFIRTTIFDTLHLLYEDLKLSVITQPWCQKLGQVLIACCSETMLDFAEHYGQDNQRRLENATRGPRHGSRLTSFVKPPCIMSWIADCLERKSDNKSWVYSSTINLACPRIQVVRDTFTVLASPSMTNIERDVKVVKMLLQAGITDSRVVQDDFPVGVTFPLMEVLARCRDYPQIAEVEELSEEAWEIIGRVDILKQNEEAQAPFHTSQQSESRSHDIDSDGLGAIESTYALRFPMDNRLKEVARLLRSSRPLFLKVTKAVELSDHDYEKLKQERLATLSRQTLALPVGRGMLTLGTLSPVPAEQLPIPKLCLSGRVPPTNSSIALDLGTLPADLTMWPEFHNGVAAGLRLPRAEFLSSRRKISRSWIIYNKSVSCSGDSSGSGEIRLAHAHGGLLFALGLRGHLSALSMTDIYEYLTQGSVTTSVGVLLGVAANKRGTCDPSVSKVLCLHIPSLLPPSFSSIDVSAPAHAAAVAGIGLLYQGSSHRLMTEFLLNEMGRRPVHDSSTIDREAYTLCCGISLGMINLAKGGKNAGLADLDIEQRLYRYIVGGIDDREQRKGQDSADRRLTGSGGAVGESERCSRVYEGDAINNDVTAPGALLALGLMYFDSGNQAVAAGLALPDTTFLLEYSRPDTLMLRVLARSMILWDDILPTVGWIELQIPPVVRRAYLRMRSIAMKSTQDMMGAFVDQLDGNVSIKSESSYIPPCQHQSRFGGLRAENLGTGNDTEDIDRQTVRQIHAYIVAGSCFSMGLRFSGTADFRAARAITEVLLELKSFRDSNDPVSVALRPEQSIIGMCLGLCAISLSLVMAGTGDLKTLRLLKMIRWRSDNQIRHGDHMTIAAAIGLLFLGSGTCTVGRSAEDVAAMVAAFFPRFPMTTLDNKYHLQALRHLYALAVDARHVQAVDVDSGDAVSVLVEACCEVHDSDPVRLFTPTLLANSKFSFTKLVVRSAVYFPSSLTADRASCSKGFSLFVKKRDRITCQQLAESTTPRALSDTNLHKLFSIFNRKRGDFDCQCHEPRRRFCFENGFGCISALVVPPTVHALSPLGVTNSERIYSVVWDTMLLQYYYFDLGDVVSRLVDADSLALIVEKVRRRLQGKDMRQPCREHSNDIGTHWSATIP